MEQIIPEENVNTISLNNFRINAFKIILVIYDLLAINGAEIVIQ